MSSLEITVSSIKSVVEDSAAASSLIRNISSATTEQSDAIRQISDALSQISEVTKVNSATASESARTSLAMKEQADVLKDLLEHYKYE